MDGLRAVEFEKGEIKEQEDNVRGNWRNYNVVQKWPTKAWTFDIWPIQLKKIYRGLYCWSLIQIKWQQAKCFW